MLEPERRALRRAAKCADTLDTLERAGNADALLAYVKQLEVEAAFHSDVLDMLVAHTARLRQIAERAAQELDSTRQPREVGMITALAVIRNLAEVP